MRRLLPYLLFLFSLSFWAKEKPIVYLDLRNLAHADLNDSITRLDVWDQLHAISTLQGIVNRKEPRLYIEYVETDGRSIDAYWWQKYRDKGEWLSGRDTIQLNNVLEAVQYFQSELNGMVVYDSNTPSTSNVASSVAGMENLIAIRMDKRPTSLYSKVARLGLPSKVWLVNLDGAPLFTGRGIIPGTNRPSSGSTKCDPYLWFMGKYMKPGQSDGKYIGYYVDQTWRKYWNHGPTNHHTLTNHDFFIARRGFVFDLSPWEDEATDDVTQPTGTDHKTLCELLEKAYELRRGKTPGYVGGFPAWAYKYTTHVGGHHEDVATEWHFAELISRYMTFKDADAIGYGALANASFWQHFPTKHRYKQHWISRKQLQEKGYLTQDGRVDTTRHYLIIYVGDYDASSWITQRTPTLWDNPDRGKLPMMWCISPVLAERVPMVMHNFRMTATQNDYFAAADNGAGYLMPGVAEQEGKPADIDIWERHCQKYYKKWGLSITGFIIDGNGPAMKEKALDAYAKFSPNGIVPQKCELIGQHKGMPILRSNWDINDGDPKLAAKVLVEHLHHEIPFDWFRIILKSPTWYVQTIKEAQKLDPSITLLDAPTYFSLLKIYTAERN